MTLDDFFKEEKILDYIYRSRASLAKRRSKKQVIHSLTSNPEYNFHKKKRVSSVSSDDEVLLNKILPPRNKWRKLNKKQRIIDGQKINNVKNVEKSLRLTVKDYKKLYPTEPFLILLDQFIQEVRDGLKESYKLSKPEIIPCCSVENGETKCRPISQYCLKDKIIIGLTNKYLTSIFDNQFLDCSYAFRKSNCGTNELPHHKAIRGICNHKEKYNYEKWWVTECDIKKFYDSVNHSIIKTYFKKLVSQVKLQTGKDVDNRAINIFYKYLDSYSYYRDVYLKNNDKDFKLKYNLAPNIEFKWVKDELINQNIYKRINSGSKIGVPQGGALSGLIANIVLHQADKCVLKIKDNLLGYYRYCDDIIIFHPEKQVTDSAVTLYKSALKKLKLIFHDFVSLNIADRKSFWQIKSKNTYEWSNDPLNGMEWVGFLGYEIRDNNEIRVRIRSIEKEKKKQQHTVNKIFKAIKSGRRKSDDTIIESVTHQLIGMAVGRVAPYNYKQIVPDMCWANGFKELNNNMACRRELKILDRNRQKQITWLKYSLNKSKEVEIKMKLPIVPKFAFTRIKGIKKQDSIDIREQLKSASILTSKYRLYMRVEEIKNLELVIDKHFLIHEKEILKVLSNLKKNRSIGFYGKPYSYYYQVLKNKELTIPIP